MSKVMLPTTRFAPPKISTEELARRQGVVPVKRWDDLSACRPGEEDPQIMQAFVLNQRQKRRAVKL